MSDTSTENKNNKAKKWDFGVVRGLKGLKSKVTKWTTGTKTTDQETATNQQSSNSDRKMPPKTTLITEAKPVENNVSETNTIPVVDAAPLPNTRQSREETPTADRTAVVKARTVTVSSIAKDLIAAAGNIKDKHNCPREIRELNNLVALRQSLDKYKKALNQSGTTDNDTINAIEKDIATINKLIALQNIACYKLLDRSKTSHINIDDIMQGAEQMNVSSLKKEDIKSLYRNFYGPNESTITPNLKSYVTIPDRSISRKLEGLNLQGMRTISNFREADNLEKAIEKAVGRATDQTEDLSALATLGKDMEARRDTAEQRNTQNTARSKSNVKKAKPSNKTTGGRLKQ